MLWVSLTVKYPSSFLTTSLNQHPKILFACLNHSCFNVRILFFFKFFSNHTVLCKHLIQYKHLFAEPILAYKNTLFIMSQKKCFYSISLAKQGGCGEFNLFSRIKEFFCYNFLSEHTIQIGPSSNELLLVFIMDNTMTLHQFAPTP